MRYTDSKNLLISVALLLSACAAPPVLDSTSYPDVIARECAVTTRIADSRPRTTLLRDATQIPGQTQAISTFGLTVGDIDGDLRDDIIHGSHVFRSQVLLNQGAGFVDASSAISHPLEGKLDAHGHNLVDIDSDGDQDLLISVGAGQGVGRGSPNMLFRNDSSEGSPRFTAVDLPAAMASPRTRSRAFIPIASLDGEGVDLYMTGYRREGFPNQLFSRQPNGSASDWFASKNGFLNVSIGDQGGGVVADFDGDGARDYLFVDDSVARIKWHPRSRRAAASLSGADVVSLVAADFNNDGNLDIAVGRRVADRWVDRYGTDGERLIYWVNRPNDSIHKSLSFAAGESLEVDLRQWLTVKERGVLRNRRDIYLGRNMQNPQDILTNKNGVKRLRFFRVTAAKAEGKPASFERPGVYIWYDSDVGRWHLQWSFYEALNRYVGSIRGSDIRDIKTSGLSEAQNKMVSDVILLNEGDGTFKVACTPALHHQSWTHSLTAVDVNEDGYIDLVGVRRNRGGGTSPTPFVLLNTRQETFEYLPLPVRREDILSSPDQVAHGFFDENNAPDIVISNGAGVPPNNSGRLRILLNQSTHESASARFFLETDSANRFALGVRLRLYDAGNQMLGYRVTGLNINRSQDTLWQHFGLGHSKGPYVLEVEWPDGRVDTYPFSDPGAYRIRRGNNELLLHTLKKD